jgi:hypothetical protein
MGDNEEKTYNDQHEVFENRFEVRVPRDGDCNVAAGPEQRPHKTRYTCSESREDLHAKGDGVYVRAIVCDN